MNQATLVIERTGQEPQTVKSQETDPLEGLWTPGDHAHASVSITVGTQVGFGRAKISATVSLACDQTQVKLDAAALTAFKQAMSYANEGLQLLTQSEGGT